MPVDNFPVEDSQGPTMRWGQGPTISCTRLTLQGPTNCASGSNDALGHRRTVGEMHQEKRSGVWSQPCTKWGPHDLWKTPAADAPRPCPRTTLPDNATGNEAHNGNRERNDMPEHSTRHEPICEFTDLPISMCAHCHGNNSEPEYLGIHEFNDAINELMKPVTLTDYQHLPLYATSPTVDPDTRTPCQATHCTGTCLLGYTLCPACIDQLEVDLANVPSILEDLAVTQRRQATATHRTSTRGRAESAAILERWPGFDETATNPDTIVTAQLAAQDAANRWLHILGRTRPDQATATDLIHDLTFALQRAAMMWLTTPATRHYAKRDATTDTSRATTPTQQLTARRIDPRPVGELDPATIATHLGANLDRIAHTNLAPAFADTLRALSRRALHLIDNAPELIHWGTCPTVLDDGQPCGQPIDIPADQTTWQCPTCATVHHTATLQAARINRARDLLLTVTEIRHLTHLTDDTIRARIRRWHITPAAHTAGIALYRGADILDHLPAHA